ncbi:hypothetical protein TcCL_ESM10482 [Trypanosoma cruzi]|nr:hypothetical protein TcCL_ESM10482 [Trypanosoma cruzi]
MPWALTMCVTTLVQQLQCLPHTGQSAGRRIVAGWSPVAGGGVSVRNSLLTCCEASAPHQRHVLGMAGCSGRGRHLYLCKTPVRKQPGAASSPRVRVESVRVGSQSPDTVERQASGLSCRTPIIRSASATMPVLHVPVSCARSDASLAYASHASFLGMSQWPKTNCIRVCATRCCGREKRVRPKCESPGDPEPSTCAHVLPQFDEKSQRRTLPWKKSR